ncbi:SWI3 [Candida pseudojiufengensis]|uniref:SWI3 n=1 Tax=Candida pseudojiufengensis TaxID=497109 RepID=UPI0022250080|nr:SWI3 [Candida pseudojiufengensis]KAI5966225.1 SWI3 [Candida pseudojiufengensis]
MSSISPDEKIKEAESLDNNNKSSNTNDIPAQTINETKESDETNRDNRNKEREDLRNESSKSNDEDEDDEEDNKDSQNEDDDDEDDDEEDSQQLDNTDEQLNNAQDFQEKELTTENLDEKQIEEMKNLSDHQPTKIPNDLESDSLTHLNADKLNNRDKSDNLDLPNDLLENQENDQNDIEGKVNNEDLNEKNGFKIDDGKNLEEQDNEDNSNYSRNQTQHADAIVEEQLPSIPVDQVPVDEPFDDKANFVGRASKASLMSNKGTSSDEQQNDDDSYLENNNQEQTNKNDANEEGKILENGFKNNDLSDNNDIDPTAPDHNIYEDQMDIDIPTETNDIAYASGIGNKEYDAEEKSQEKGEDEMLSYAQVDDPAFDADFNVEDSEKSGDEFDASLLESETEKPKDEKIESQDNKAEHNNKSNDVKEESKSANGSDQTKAEPTPSLSSESNETRATGIDQEEDLDMEDVIEDEEDEPVKATKKYKQTHLIIIPSYASWFNMKKIHKIEKQSLSEFFDSSHPSKSPKLYANYRNFMINAYRLNPNEFLTLTSCRRNLVGDVGTLMRVHRFLNKWGLINYQVKPHFKPGYAFEKMPNGSSVDLPYTGDYHVKYDSPRGLFPFDTSRIPLDKIDVEKLKKLISLPDSVNSAGFENGNKERGTKRKLSIENQPSKDEPQNKRKHKQDEDDDGWTQEESNNLINAIAKHKNDWYQIASEVGGNKTPQQCVLKFLKLPIEDQFNPIKDSDKEDIKLLKYASNYPINGLDNPVLANLVFMTRIVDSNVAKAASEAACKAMDESIRNKINEVYGGDGKGKEEAKIKTDVVNSKELENKDDDSEERNGSIEKDDSTHDNKTEEAIATTFGIVGGRSHLFSSYEERELHKISMSIVNHELQKCETKLAKIEELEKIYERERQNLSKQQEEIFTDRLSLTRSTIDVIKKLEEACSLLESNDQTTQKSEFQKIISDARSLLYKPVKQSLEAVGSKADNQQEQLDNREGKNDQDKDSMISEGSKKSVDDFSNIDDYKPLSLIAPQTFKIWAP